MIFVIIGKSSSGKNTIYEHLLYVVNMGVKFESIVPYTTRPKRANEIEGKDYHFVTETDYTALMKEGKVIEHRIYNTINGLWRYFTVDDGNFDHSKVYLTIGTLESFASIKKYFEGITEVIPIYIVASDIVRLNRAIKRESMNVNPNFVEVCRRFVADAEDFSDQKVKEAFKDCNNCITFNNDIDESVLLDDTDNLYLIKQIKSIIKRGELC